MSLVLLPGLYVAATAGQWLILGVYVWVALVLLIPQMLLLLWPNRLEIREDGLLARGWFDVATPRDNVGQIGYDGTSLCVRFRSLDQVRSPVWVRRGMTTAHRRHGHHIAFPGFTLTQVEALRQHLGMVEDAVGGSLERVRLYQLAVRHNTPRVYVTPLLMVANVAIFLFMTLAGVSPTVPEPIHLIHWGANFGPLTARGEGWRLLTCTFLHAGLLHLFVNMWVLFTVGPALERLLGNLGFLLLYVAAGMVGSIVSVTWNPLMVGVGASGSIFGLFGGLLGYLLLHRSSVPPSVYRGLWRTGIAFLGYNLLFGWVVPNLDMGAHLGGAAAGFLGGLILSQPADAYTRRVRLQRNALLAAAASLAIVPAFFWLPAPPVNDGAFFLLAYEYQEAEGALVEKYNRALGRGKAGDFTDEQMANLLEEHILPPWRSYRLRFAVLPPVSPRFQKLAALTVQFMALQQESWELFARALRTNDSALASQSHEKSAAAAALLPQIQQERLR